jgi:DNA-binding MarR family transcriptional regulator
VNGLELYILGRRLMKLGQDATPQAGMHRLPTSVQLVLIDVSEHPDTSVSEVVARTGFPQSLVSAAIARLRDGGALQTSTDPADRRRTLVRVKADIPKKARRVPSKPVEEVIGTALGIDDPAEVTELVAVLADLAARFEPVEARPGPETVKEGKK